MNRLLTTFVIAAFGNILTAVAQPIFWGSLCENRSVCLNFGSCSVGNVAISELAATTCGNPDVTYLYQLDLDSNGSFDQIASKDTLTGPLPRGIHRIFWRASDACGRVINCSYTITVDDCESPTLLCKGGISIGLSAPDCRETFSSAQFINNLSDNCTPTNLIKRGLRRVGDGTGFPPTDSITFERCNVGVNLVEVWVQDQKGRQNQCNTYVLVQENNSVCPCVLDANINMRGCVKSGNNTKLGGYKISNTIKTELNGLPALNKSFSQNIATDSCFNYNIPKIPLGGPFRVTTRASRTVGTYLDGITTADLALISRHILNIQPFQTIYQALAADVNGSNTVTTLDIVEIRRLILGISDSIAGVPSWRMVRPVANPASVTGLETVRDTYQTVIPSLQTDFTVANRHFIGLKMGDVNFSSPVFAANTPADDRAPIPLLIQDRWLTAGEKMTIPVVLSENMAASAWQLALQLDTNMIRLTQVNKVDSDHYFQDKNGVLRALWYAENDQFFLKNEPLLELGIEVLHNTQLSAALALSTTTLQPEVSALQNDGDRHRALTLHFSGNNAPAYCFPPQPNPFRQETVFRLQLEQPMPIQIEIFNQTGQLVCSKNMEGVTGLQEIAVQARELGNSEGLLLYRLRAGGNIKSGKLLLISP